MTPICRTFSRLTAYLYNEIWVANLLLFGLSSCAEPPQTPIATAHGETASDPTDPNLGDLLSVETFSYRDSAEHPGLAEEEQPLVTVTLILSERGVRVSTSVSDPTVLCDANQWVRQASTELPLVSEDEDPQDWTYHPRNYNGCEELQPGQDYTADLPLADRMGMDATRPFTLAHDARNEAAIWHLPSGTHGPPEHSQAGGNGNGQGNGQGNGHGQSSMQGPPDHSHAGGNGNGPGNGTSPGNGNGQDGTHGPPEFSNPGENGSAQVNAQGPGGTQGQQETSLPGGESGQESHGGIDHHPTPALPPGTADPTAGNGNGRSTGPVQEPS